MVPTPDKACKSPEQYVEEDKHCPCTKATSLTKGLLFL